MRFNGSLHNKMCEIISYKDFTVESGEDGSRKLRINLPSNYAVLIMSSAKDEGLRVKQILNNLRIAGLGKACLDIMQGGNKRLSKMSLSTKTPIRRVPMLFFVVDGRVRAIYNKKVSPREIEYWFREKHQKFGSIQPNRERRAQHTMYAQEPQITNRRRTNKNYHISDQEVERSEQRSVGAPTGINAAWRTDR